MQLVLGNWDLFLQVLDNLLGNALKFSKSNGKIILRAYTWPDLCLASSKKKTNDAPYCEVISPLPRLRVEVSDTEVPAWQDCCSYVPQSITLLNSNIPVSYTHLTLPTKA